MNLSHAITDLQQRADRSLSSLAIFSTLKSSSASMKHVGFLCISAGDLCTEIHIYTASQPCANRNHSAHGIISPQQVFMLEEVSCYCITYPNDTQNNQAFGCQTRQETTATAVQPQVYHPSRKHFSIFLGMNDGQQTWRLEWNIVTSARIVRHISIVMANSIYLPYL